MDVTDALRRIVMRHLLLIAIVTVAVTAAFAVYKATSPATYTARVQVEVADRAATSAQMATAVADTASAYTKATDTVSAALTLANVHHDVNDFIMNDLTVGPVLTAPDIEVDVKYTNKQDAVNIAQALADSTVKYFFDQATSGPKTTLDSLNKQMTDVTNDLKVVGPKAGAIAPGLANPYTSQVTLDQQQILALNKQITDTQSKINEAYKPTIVDDAKIVPQTTLSMIQPYVLVFIVALILGIGIAAVIESASPSVVGAAGLSGLFGAPFLGYAVGRNGKTKDRITDLALAARLHAAARRVGADTVVIAGDVRCDLPDLAGRLDALLGGATSQQVHGTVPGQTVETGQDPQMLNPGEGSKELATRGSAAPALFSERLSFGEDIPSVWVHPRVVPYDEQVLLLLSTAPVSVAVAVVGAPKAKRKDLTPAIELVETSGWEILGTILADATRKTGTV